MSVKIPVLANKDANRRARALDLAISETTDSDYRDAAELLVQEMINENSFEEAMSEPMAVKEFFLRLNDRLE